MVEVTGPAECFSQGVLHPQKVHWIGHDIVAKTPDPGADGPCAEGRGHGASLSVYVCQGSGIVLEYLDVPVMEKRQGHVAS